MNTVSRKLHRLPIHLYREGGFFVTINVHQHKKVFGEVVGEEMKLNTYGKIVQECRRDLPKHYICCILADFVIMPNHMHAILYIEGQTSSVREGFKPSPTKQYGLSEILRWFKTFSSRNIHNSWLPSFKWQRSFYDHIIRNEEDLQNIQEYIELNPYKRENDEYYVK